MPYRMANRLSDWRRVRLVPLSWRPTHQWAIAMDEEGPRLREESALSAKVRTICQIYNGSAESVGSGEFSKDNEIGQYEKDRYEKGREEALEIAIKLEDDFYRDTALHALFDFCMKAKDMEFGTIIAEAITVEVIQDKIVEEYPHYFLLDRRDGRVHPTTAASLGYFLK
jgi:hypothetical protein